jgi:hypothetical protein
VKNRIRWLAAALCLLVGLLAGCGADDESQALYADRADLERGALTGAERAADAGAVLDSLARAGQINDEGREAVIPPEDNGPGQELWTAESASASTVQTDGSYIYMLDSYGLIVVSAEGADSRILSYTRVDLEEDETVDGIFVRGDRVAVVCGSEAFGFDEAGNWNAAAETLVVLLDVSDRTAPKEVARTKVDGALLRAGMTDDGLCVATQRTLWTLPDRGGAEAVMPWVEEDGERTALRPTDVYLRTEPMKAACTVVALLRPEDGRVLDAMALTDGADAVLLAGNELYLARTRWTELRSEPDRSEPPYTVVTYTQEARTEIVRLSLRGGIRLTGGCEQAGTLADASALSLWNGTLRAALQPDVCVFRAYTDEAHGWTNYEPVSRERSSRIVLLDAALETGLGMLDNLGGEDGILACRFLDGCAWLVKDQSGDTVYCAALADPAAPAMAGSLKLAGTARCLYSFGDGLAAALSAGSAEDSVKLSVLNVSEPDRVRTADAVTVSRGASLLRRPEVLFLDPETGLLGLLRKDDGNEYLLYRWNGKSLREIGTLALEYVPEDARTLLIGGLLYICGPGEVYVADPETGKLAATVSNAVG